MLLHDATRRAAGVQLKGQVKLDTRLNINTLILLVFLMKQQSTRGHFTARVNEMNG